MPWRFFVLLLASSCSLILQKVLPDAPTHSVETWPDQPTPERRWYKGVWSSPSGDTFFVGSDGIILQAKQHANRRFLQLNPAQRPSDSNLFGIWGDAQNNLFLCGEKGLLSSSPDGGVTWHPYNTQTEATLYQLWGTGQSLFAVGASGTIIASSDGGKTFHQQQSNTSDDLYAVWGRSSKEVYAVGQGTIVYTYNGGATWEVLATSTTLRAIWGSSLGDLYAVGDGGIILRQQGGLWSIVPTNRQEPLYAIWGEASSIFVAGNGGLILHSPDSGLTWYTHQSQSTRDLRGVFVSKEGQTTLVGTWGEILQYPANLPPDATTPWSVQQSNTQKHFSSVWGDTAGVLYVAGENGLFLVSYDQGKTWRERTYDVTPWLSSVWGSSAQNIYVVGAEGTILHSKDGGLRWKKEESNTKAYLLDVWGSSENDVYAVGSGGVVLHSTDGETWQSERPTEEWLYGVWGRSAKEVYAVGTKGTLLRSLDYGKTWVEQATKTKKDLYAIAGTDSALYAVGANGTVLSLEGERWQAKDLNVSGSLYSVWGGAGGFIAVGDLGTIVRWNKDQFWGPNPGAIQATLQGVSGTETGEVYVVGREGIVLLSKDQGNTWRLETSKVAPRP